MGKMPRKERYYERKDFYQQQHRYHLRVRQPGGERQFISKAISLFEATLACKDGKKEFSAICGISALRHVRTDWRESCPDRFYFYKNGKSYWTEVAALRYDGENANCVCTGRN